MLVKAFYTAIVVDELCYPINLIVQGSSVQVNLKYLRHSSSLNSLMLKIEHEIVIERTLHSSMSLFA